MFWNSKTSQPYFVLVYLQVGSRDTSSHPSNVYDPLCIQESVTVTDSTDSEQPIKSQLMSNEPMKSNHGYQMSTKKVFNQPMRVRPQSFIPNVPVNSPQTQPSVDSSVANITAASVSHCANMETTPKRSHRYHHYNSDLFMNYLLAFEPWWSILPEFCCTKFIFFLYWGSNACFVSPNMTWKIITYFQASGSWRVDYLWLSASASFSNLLLCHSHELSKYTLHFTHIFYTFRVCAVQNKEVRLSSFKQHYSLNRTLIRQILPELSHHKQIHQPLLSPNVYWVWVVSLVSCEFLYVLSVSFLYRPVCSTEGSIEYRIF